MIIDYPWYYVLFCLLAGVVYAVAMYHIGRRSFRRGLNLTLSLVRMVAVTAIAMLLLAPVAKQIAHEEQKPVVVMAQDVSESIRNDEQRVLDKELFDKSGKYEVVYEEFGGSTTDISAELADIASRYQGRNLGAVVIASDGIYNRGSNPTSSAERLSFPVYTVALGDTTPQQDASLASIRHNHIVFSGNTFPVEVTVNATRLKGNTAMLSIFDSQKRQISKQEVDYTDDNFSSTLTFELKAEKAGLQQYTVSLTVVDGEKSSSNNTLTFYTDIIDGRRKVAIVGNAPHPDLAALKRAVESNPNYEATMLLASDLQNTRANVQDSGFSLVILHNLPSSSYAIPKSLEGLSQVFVIGTQTDLPRFNALHSGLEIVSRTKKSNEVTALFNDRFSLFTLEGEDAAALEELPPLSAPFGEARSSSSLQSLFTARLGSINTQQPLVAAMAQGTQRRVFFWGEGLWRWRLNDFQNNKTHGHFDHLISQVVNFAAINDQRERFITETDRHYSDNDEIVVRAQLYNEAFEPFNIPDATLTLSGDSVKGDFNFTRQGDGYTLTLGRLPEGLYRYTATTAYNGSSFSSDGSFAVEALRLEQANLTADHSLLATVSTITGGKMFYPGQLSALLSELASLKPVIYTHTKFSELINLPWVLILIVLLLSTEWVLRKYHGEI